MGSGAGRAPLRYLGHHVGVDLADAVQAVGLHASGGGKGEDEVVLHELLADGDVGEDMEGGVVVVIDGVPPHRDAGVDI